MYFTYLNIDNDPKIVPEIRAKMTNLNDLMEINVIYIDRTDRRY